MFPLSTIVTSLRDKQNPLKKMNVQRLPQESFIHPRIVLAGMMGSGKSTIGKLLADYLGWELVDTDAVLEQKAGKPITEIFANDGEEHFRSLERQLAEDLKTRQNCVFAAGGGMLMQKRNHENLCKNALVVHLQAPVETLLDRLDQTETRPLLGINPEINLNKIYQERKSVYESLLLQINTDNKRPNHVAQEILVHFVRIHNHLYEGEFKVRSGLNLLSTLPGIFSDNQISSPVFILADAAIWHLVENWWLQKLSEFTENKCKFVTIPLPGNEETKSSEVIFSLWEQLVEQGVQRSSAVIVIGGGVLGDVGGFIASTILRGIHLIQIPTTLLAQIDAAIGGKTGINIKTNKNMVGTFYPANHTLLDPLFLITLSQREFSCGLAEMIKAAVIADVEFFEFLETNLDQIQQRRLDVLLQAVEWSAKIKLAIVSEDLLDKSGRRALLNLGHTLGHALESVSEFDLRHGEAVAVGMVLATRLAIKRRFCEPGVLKRLTTLLKSARLPVVMPKYPIEKILEKVKLDKKRSQDVLQFVIPTEIGKTQLLPIQSDAELLLAFED